MVSVQVNKPKRPALGAFFFFSICAPKEGGCHVQRDDHCELGIKTGTIDLNVVYRVG